MISKTKKKPFDPSDKSISKGIGGVQTTLIKPPSIENISKESRNVLQKTRQEKVQVYREPRGCGCF